MAPSLWLPRTAGPRFLWLVRHGQSEANVLRDDAELRGDAHATRPARDADVELTELGRRQAQALGRWFADQREQPDMVLSSPFQRAVATAQEICGQSDTLSGLTLHTDERLRDRDMGVLDELTWTGIQQEFPAEAQRALRDGFFYFRPPGGESWADICLRLRSLLGDVVQTPTNGLLVVAHDIVVQLTVALLTGLDESATVAQVRGTKYANCGLAMLRRDDDGYQVIAYNSTAPVQEQGTPPTEEADASDVLT